MTLSVQFITLLSMIGMGCIFAASFDTYNRFIKRGTRNKWVVFVHDILFWCMQAIWIYFILFLANSGEIRLYLFLSLLCGYAFYQALLKNTFLKILEGMIALSLRTWRLLTKLVNLLLIRPIKWMILLLSGLLVLCFSLVTKALKGTFYLAKTLLRGLLFILGILLSPLFWILKQIYKVVPKKLRGKINRAVNKWIDTLLKLKNKLSEIIAKWKNKSR